MLRIAICDDDPSIHDDLRRMLADCSVGTWQDLEVLHFHSAKELLEAPFDYAVLFLDIMLEDDLDGIEIGLRLREKENHALFIIITSRADRSEDAYEATTFRFLVKPLSQEKVDKVMLDVQKYTLYYSQEHIRINYRQVDYIFNIRDIVLIESYMRQRHIITMDSKCSTNEGWETLLSRLKSFPCFTRIGKSYYINMHYIRLVSTNSITLANGMLINFNKHSREKFHNEYNAFLSEQGGLK